jgi:hypothetical protein
LNWYFQIFVWKMNRLEKCLALYSNQNQGTWTPQFLLQHLKGEEHLRAAWEELMKKQFDHLPEVRVEFTEIEVENDVFKNYNKPFCIPI